ncbi:hypothetical protein GC176_26055 [bacterium]|nr:hypothetical protein [bacterium]
MRRTALLTAVLMIAVLVVGANRAPETCRVTLRLIDAESGEALAGVVQVRDADGRHIELPGLLSRGQGLDDELSIHDWSVLPQATSVDLPRAKLTFEAFSGLETERLTQTVDLSNSTETEVRLPLTRFFRREHADLVSGNTHLHIMKLSRQECDRYLTDIPRSDDLDVLFLSYLERADADRDYISNGYSREDLAKLTAASGVVFGNGEEHRHNFTGFGQGYGHVMLLNIRELIQPVSIGPGIMKTGSDGIPLTRGIQQARRDGATAIWCHNVFGHEADPNWLLGRLDAMNIYDGGARAGFKERFYPLLNVGLKVPFSTGTDWFLYDLSRVYVQMQKQTTVDNWLDALSSGRSFITNSALFRFRVDTAEIGDTLKLEKPGSVTVSGQVEGRIDFQRAELVHNGEVIAAVDARPVGNHFLAELNLRVPINQPSWLALRIPSPNLSDEGPQTPLNEFGRKLYGHTSPIYVEIAGRKSLDVRVARALLEKMKTARAEISTNGVFDDAQAKARVLDVYDEARELLSNRLPE